MDLVSVTNLRLASMVVVEGKFECREKARERKAILNFE